MPVPRQPHSAEEIAWFQGRVSKWFESNARTFPWRGKPSPYEVVVAEVLLQRTTAAAVSAFLPGFLQQFPNWQALADAPLEDLEQALRPVGLWRRRATSLKKLADAVLQTGGMLPRDHEVVARLPGVGQYIANAISLVIQGEPRPLLDTNMARVLERFFGPRRLADIRHDPYLQETASRVVTCANPLAINWAILDLAAAVCRPRRPMCPSCPLSERCKTGRVVLETGSGHHSGPAAGRTIAVV
jgi:A/G-specific adenine glycosylase